jgi:hypothetical protein
MDFLKRAAEAITHSEERAAIAKEKDYTKPDYLTTKDEIYVAPAPLATNTVVSATPEQVTAVTGEAEITTMKAATVDTIARAPVIDETIIQEQRESMYLTTFIEL